MRMNERDGDDERLHRIAEDPRYQALVRLRGRISWSLSVVVVAIFFGYMLLVAFANRRFDADAAALLQDHFE